MDGVEGNSESPPAKACGGAQKSSGASTFPAEVSCQSLSLSTSAMEASQRGPVSLFRSLLLILALNVILPAKALYFYLDGASASPKCFYEELPKDTLVVGERPLLSNIQARS